MRAGGAERGKLMTHASVGGRICGFVVSSLALGAFGPLPQAGAAPLGIGYRETLTLSVPAATTSNITDRLWVAEGTLDRKSVV